VPAPDGPGPDEPGQPGRPDEPGPGPGEPPAPNPRPSDAPRPRVAELSLTPDAFVPAKRGPAISRRGRAGAALRFRLSEPATVRFRVATAPQRLRFQMRVGGAPQRLRFQVRGRAGLNRLRFSGRIRGRALRDGPYVLTAVATDRRGADSAPATVRFAIEGRSD
jgi:hypothetical protein